MMRKLGIQVWPSPDVMEFMGAKDALCKVANMNIGLVDTFAYYDPARLWSRPNCEATRLDSIRLSPE
jgi:hypothetical protein